MPCERPFSTSASLSRWFCSIHLARESLFSLGSGPYRWLYIRDRLRKSPRVSGEVNRVVLPLAVRMSHRLLCNTRAVNFSPVAVGISVRHANRDGESHAQSCAGLVLSHFPHNQYSVPDI